PAHHLAIAGRLRLEKGAGGLLLLQQAGIRLLEPIAALLVRVDARLVLRARGERLLARREHSVLAGEHFHPRDVDGTPDARAPARREADGVALGVDGLPDPVDPAHAQRFVDGLGPGDARMARALLVEADPQLL